MKGYVDTLLVAFGNQTGIQLFDPTRNNASAFSPQPSSFILQPLAEPLSERELEVLRLVAQGLSNREIGERLFLALDTVKGHNRRIYDKLHVQRRTEAIARARELGLLER
jgi:LuxR family maltose regulon positive regulatory protein